MRLERKIRKREVTVGFPNPGRCYEEETLTEGS